MSIGANESLGDVSFTWRPKPPYTLRNCPAIGRRYQWAELKSSLLQFLAMGAPRTGPM